LLVTVADVPLLNVGAAFWGLLFGFAIHWISEKADAAGTAKS
jgi:benzoate membrane transport protein